MQEDKYSDKYAEMKKYLREHANINKELTGFGILVLRLWVSDANEVIEKLKAATFDIH